MSTITQHDLFGPTELAENPRFLQQQIITYIGNKRSLLPFIDKAVQLVKKRLGKSKLTIGDLFAGSGVTSRFFKQHAEHLIINDLETYSRLVAECYLSNKSSIDWNALEESFQVLKNDIQVHLHPGFITELYSPKDESNITPEDRVFYSRRNAIYLDTARQAISRLPLELQRYFLGPLLARASVHTNTSGVFKGFYKSELGVGQFGGSGKNALTRILGDIEVELPILSNFDCNADFFQEDANLLCKKLRELDMIYLDPPYNQHPYGSNYFMLNLLLSYKRPSSVSRVSGIPIDWTRSRYNQRAEAEGALFELVGACNAKYILISYNSEGFISYDRFTDGLKRLGKVSALETTYNAFRGSRNLSGRSIHVTEFLFMIEKN